MRRCLILLVSLLAACSTSPARDVAPTGAKKTPMHSSDPAIDRAMKALYAAAEKVRNDPTQPVFHFRPPAQWMNDPCGGLYHKGWYHIFYQLNPYGDTWAEIHWGHARSKDLVYWERLPIAMAPLPHEVRCNSGCVTINKRKEPMILYTSVLRGSPRQQCAALGDDDLITWKRHPDNPLLDLKTHGGPKFGGGWSDMFVFEEAGRTFMLIGVDNLGSDVAVPIYETQDPGFSRWKYKGLLYRAAKKKIRNMEVPMFCKLGGKWVLLFHPGGAIKYLIGDFDLGSLTFKPETEGEITPSRDFMSPHIFFDDKDRCILYGWIRGFKSGRGWNGCMSLPRVISLDEAGNLRQRPVPELSKLRTKHSKHEKMTLNNAATQLENPGTNTLEIIVTFESGSAKTFGLRLGRSKEQEKTVTISYDNRNLTVAGVETALALDNADKTLTLHIFLDRTVLEVFANDGRRYMAKVVYLDQDKPDIELFAEGGTATVRSLDLWNIKSIW